MGLIRFLDPCVDRRIVADEGEVVIDEVTRHWITRVLPVLRVVLGMVLFLVMPFAKNIWWLPMLLGLGLGLHGFWRMHAEFMDRFVITNMRVFRVHGILEQHLASVPLTRILDISVKRPFWGQVFGYAHFVFESAAQDQGLREIRFIGRPDERDLTIQRIIARSGLGGRAKLTEDTLSGI